MTFTLYNDHNFFIIPAAVTTRRCRLSCQLWRRSRCMVWPLLRTSHSHLTTPSGPRRPMLPSKSPQRPAKNMTQRYYFGSHNHNYDVIPQLSILYTFICASLCFLKLVIFYVCTYVCSLQLLMRRLLQFPSPTLTPASLQHLRPSQVVSSHETFSTKY